MANRYLKDRQLSFEQEPVTLYFNFASNGSTTVSAIKGGGIATITAAATGIYTVTLSDSYSKVLSFKLNTIGTNLGVIVAAYPNYSSMANMTTAIKAKTFAFVTVSATATPAYVPNGGVAVCELVVRNSSVGPWD